MEFKKIVSLIMLVVTFFCFFNISASADGEIKVLLNDEYINFDVQPQLIKGRTMVPVRAIFEALGAEIEWEDTTRSVIAFKDRTVIWITIDDNRMFVGERMVILDVPAVELGGRTLVPVRAVSEAFNCNVGWDEKTSTVKIDTKESDLLLPLNSNYITANQITSIEGQQTYTGSFLSKTPGNKLIEWENSDNKDLHVSARIYHQMLDDDTEVTLTIRVSEKTKRNEYTSYNTNVILSKSSEYSDVQLSIPFSRSTWEEYLRQGILENKPTTICYLLYYGDKLLGETLVDFQYTYASEKEIANRIKYMKPLLMGLNNLGEQVQSGNEFVSYANLSRIVCKVDLNFGINDIYDENGYLYVFPFKFHLFKENVEVGNLQSFALASDEKLEFSYGGDYKVNLNGKYRYKISLFDEVVSQADFQVKLP